MGTMVKRLSQRSVAARSRVRFPLVPQKCTAPEKGFCVLCDNSGIEGYLKIMNCFMIFRTRAAKVNRNICWRQGEDSEEQDSR